MKHEKKKKTYVITLKRKRKNKKKDRCINYLIEYNNLQETKAIHKEERKTFSVMK